MNEDWQPIDTAPKDGSGILLSNGVTVAQGQWLHQEPVFRERRDLHGRYIDQDEFDGFDGWVDWAGGLNPSPTHWMPLPKPPAPQQLQTLLAALTEISDMTFDPWTNGAEAGEIARRALKTHRQPGQA